MALNPNTISPFDMFNAVPYIEIMLKSELLWNEYPAGPSLSLDYFTVDIDKQPISGRSELVTWLFYGRYRQDE